MAGQDRGSNEPTAAQLMAYLMNGPTRLAAGSAWINTAYDAALRDGAGDTAVHTAAMSVFRRITGDAGLSRGERRERRKQGEHLPDLSSWRSDDDERVAAIVVLAYLLMAEPASPDTVGVRAATTEPADADLGQLADGSWQRAAAIIEKWPEWTEWLSWAWKHRARLEPGGDACNESKLQEQQDGIALQKDDLAILKCLAKFPDRIFIQSEIADALRRSRGAVGPRLIRLRNAGLVARLRGERGGDRITQAGLATLDRISTSAGTD